MLLDEYDESNITQIVVNGLFDLEGCIYMHCYDFWALGLFILMVMVPQQYKKENIDGYFSSYAHRFVVEAVDADSVGVILTDVGTLLAG